ncbi:MAG: amylo-alpha-1,6-glucosidase [Parachlamydia sp.]|jgi:predicted glycogen debranching enzyme|nr:amylo-alpha-1,6-glucosidase [Parachlamydia sp.]
MPISKLIRPLTFKQSSLNKSFIDPMNSSDDFLRLEWLVTNGLGGYASSTIAGVTTRKYHGLLVSSLPPPLGRTIMLNHLAEQVVFENGERFWIGCEERANGQIHFEGLQYLKEFRLEGGMPVWIFNIKGIEIEKKLNMIHLQNTVQITYRLLTPGIKIRLRIQPSLHFRGHEAPVNLPINEFYRFLACNNQYEISLSSFPPLRLKVEGSQAKFTLENSFLNNLVYRFEHRAGYESMGDLWSPGYFKVNLEEGKSAHFIASTENWEAILAMTGTDAINAEKERRNELLHSAPPELREGFAGELVLAADQFIIIPSSRVEDASRARAAGGDIRSIIAGYHWFTDWGRDTMISLEGLTLSTGRHIEAKWILLTFSHYVKEGLIPNMFPEGEIEGLYHTADATLWYFHAIDRYIQITGDRDILHTLYPILHEIIDYHLKGTAFGIGVDVKDGLLKQGIEGYQLTWMDAKVGDWVVTPRRGKAVEINALWYNALRLMEEWQPDWKKETFADFKKMAELAYQSFNEQFWNEEKGMLYDLINEMGKDPACRPNQIFSFSLKYPILQPSRWKAVLHAVEKELLTPVGLRSLSPSHPDYKSRYDGDLRARDAAYHQGTVWGWLIGPFIDAWIRVYPNDREGARRFLMTFEAHMNEAGIGSIGEIFDAQEPFIPRGCIAQAWSVAEVLRCWLKTAPR